MKHIKKKDNSLRRQLSLIVTAFYAIIIVIGLILLYNSSKQTYLTAKDDMIYRDLSRIKESSASYDGFTWFLNYWKEHPEDMKEEFTVDDLAISSDYSIYGLTEVDIDEYLSSLPADAQLAIAKDQLSILSFGLDIELSNFGYGSIYLISVEDDTAFVYHENCTNTSTLHTVGDKVSYRLSKHPAIKKLINNPELSIEFEMSKGLNSKGSNYYTGCMPIVKDGKTVAILAIGYDWNNFRRDLLKTIWIYIMVSLIGMILIYRLMMFIMDRIITKPISILQNAVEDFRLNKDSKRVHDQISLMKTNNEIHTLGNNFDDFSSAIERYIDDIHAAEDEIEKLSDEILQSLAQTIDAKDVYTKGHSIRVAKYSKMLATRLKLPEKTIENIYKQGLLHDIGKIGIPDGIINKPGKLTDEEFAIIKSHTTMGSDILSKAESFPELARAARWHHERYDGLGYPDGLSAEDIPLEVRIISVADSYDAMSSNRSYRNYLAQEVVKKEIQKGMGTQFDPEIAKIMLEIIDEDPDYELREQ